METRNRAANLALLLFALLLAACSDGRRIRIQTSEHSVGCDGVDCSASGIDVRGLGVDFRGATKAVAGQLRVRVKDKVVHEASVQPTDAKLRFPDVHIDGITPGPADQPGHLNEVSAEIELQSGGEPTRFRWTLNDSDRRG